MLTVWQSGWKAILSVDHYCIQVSLPKFSNTSADNWAIFTVCAKKNYLKRVDIETLNKVRIQFITEKKNILVNRSNWIFFFEWLLTLIHAVQYKPINTISY